MPYIKTLIALTFLIQFSCGGGSDNSSDSKKVDNSNKKETKKELSKSSFHFSYEDLKHTSNLPFPNDLFLENGKVKLPEFSKDPILKDQANEEILVNYNSYVNDLNGFSFCSGIFFFVDDEPDLESFKEKVILINLKGEEVGKILPAAVYYSKSSKALLVMPKWGYSMMQDSVYGVLIEKGVKKKDGKEFNVSGAFNQLILKLDKDPEAASKLAKARKKHELLRVYVQKSLADKKFVVGTQFTTEEVISTLTKIKEEVLKYPLGKITNVVSYDTKNKKEITAKFFEGDDLKKYFGVVEEKFKHIPTNFTDLRDRENMKYLKDYGKVYKGGQATHGFWKVINGSFTAPSIHEKVEAGELKDSGFNMAALSSKKAHYNLIPFTLILCESHKNNLKNIPLFILNHGGGTTRQDITATANLGCSLGIATLAPDMIFHGGRTKTYLEKSKNLVYPIFEDKINIFLGTTSKDKDFQPDYIGDPSSAEFGRK